MPKTDSEVLKDFLKKLGHPAGFGDLTPSVISHLLLVQSIHGKNFKLEPVYEWLENTSQRLLTLRDELKKMKDSS